jgi:hypothetical protein
MSSGVVMQLDFELGAMAYLGTQEVQVIAVTHHVNGAVIYHVAWYNIDDGEIFEAQVAGCQLK